MDAGGHPTPDPAEVAGLAAARAAVLDRIAAASARSGRSSDAVTLVAVSKTVPPERLRAAVAAGHDVLGENRVQEAAEKIPLVPGARWHLVGPLQANKARRALELFDVLEAVDSLDLARRLDRLAGEVRPGRPAAVLLQVNIDADPAKAGFTRTTAVDALPELLGLRNLEIRGLMTIGRLVDAAEEARPTFAALRTFGEDLRSRWPALGPELSMGMSDDFEIAVEEGATMVRVGRALFGERTRSASLAAEAEAEVRDGPGRGAPSGRARGTPSGRARVPGGVGFGRALSPQRPGDPGPRPVAPRHRPGPRQLGRSDGPQLGLAHRDRPDRADAGADPTAPAADRDAGPRAADPHAGAGAAPAGRLRMTARLAVRLTPRGGVDRVDGVGEDGALRARVAAPPVDGAANEALCRLLARELGVPRSAVRVVAGESGRRKIVEVAVDPAVLAGTWPELAAGGNRE